MAYRYLALARLNTQIAILNRGWILLRMVGVFVAMAVPFYVWRTVFAENARVQQFDWPQIKTYLLLGAVMAIVLSEEGSAGERIVTGDIVVDIARPVNMTLTRLAEMTGRLAFELVVVAVLWLGLTVGIGGFAMPTTAVGVGLFGVSLLLALLLKASIVHTWTLACFWTDNQYGVDRLRTAATALLSGAVVPLTLFPAWLETVAVLLPFRGMVAIPADVAIDRAGTAGALAGIGLQIGWLLALWVSNRWLWRQGLRRLTVQGG